MKITTRAILLAVALLASAPLLAASSGTSPAGPDASAQEAPTTTGPEDCTVSTPKSTDLWSGTLATLPPKPGSTTPNLTEVDRRLNKAASCVSPLGLWAPNTTLSTIAQDTMEAMSYRASLTPFSSSAPAF